MARNTLETWLPEEYSSEVIQRITRQSAIEGIARKIPMGSNLKSVPRTAGMSVDIIPKGGAYGEDTSLNDQVLLTVYKFGKVVRIAEEDIDDSLANVLEAKKTDWATSYARMIDNSTLATTAAGDGVTVAFNSVYYSLSQANAATGYTANANIVKAGVGFGSVTLTVATDLVTYQTPHNLNVGDKVSFGTITTTGGIVANTVYYVKTVPSSTTVTLSATLNGATLDFTGADGSAASATNKRGVASYLNLSAALGLLEAGDFYDEARAVIIAHPTLKKNLREVVDGYGRPIFVENPRADDPDTLFGLPIKWTNGAKTSAVSTPNPTGNPIVVFANADFLFLGVRSGPESVVIDGKDGAAALTDETLLKIRARRAFALANENAAAILEIA